MELNLKLVDQYLATSLAAADVRADMLHIARMLPFVRGFQFESRLGSPTARVDFLPRILLDDGTCDSLFGFNGQAATLPSDVQRIPSWWAIQNLCKEWRASGGALNEGVMDIFLEFDLDRESPDIPNPCVFVDFDRPVRDTHHLCVRGLELLLNGNLPGPVGQCLLNAYEELPQSARAYAVGVMFPRGTSQLRLCLDGAPFEDWLDYLDRLEWPGNRKALTEHLGPLTRMADRIGLDIDIGERIGPKIGFEFFIDESLAAAKTRWADFMNYLVHAGLSRRDKSEAALSWPGHMKESDHPDLWPAPLKATNTNAQGRGVFLRRLSHAKMVYVPDQALEAKAYLETRQSWVRYNAEMQRFVLDDTVS